MKNETNANKSEQNEQLAEGEGAKKLRTGLKIRTRLKAGDGYGDGGGMEGDGRGPNWNHGLKLRAIV